MTASWELDVSTVLISPQDHAPGDPAPAPAGAQGGEAAHGMARRLAEQFALTAAERDELGGTPKAERDALRASGLLAMSIPREHGGGGAGWRDTLDVVRILARADSSLAHVFGFHHLMLATARLFSQPHQWEPWFAQTARLRWFWGNALNPLDDRTLCTRHVGWSEFSGQKSFCSGALDSEMLIASARDEGGGALVVAALPTARTGIAVAPDWNNIGQRQTDSGSVTFERVRVEHHEILADPGPLATPFACLRPLLAQLVLTSIYLGIAEGAFQDARHYTLNEARPWRTSGVAQAADDPYVLGHYGDFWVGLESARVLLDRAADRFDAAWARDAALAAPERGDVAVAVATAKVAATRMGLDLCTRMFDVAGARATHGGLRLDRHWRNLRTHTLHDPLAYKLRELGEWALLQRHPDPSFYS
ncbi:Alkylation response protein AidB-like acyl-CoA dehydrogenase [Paracidovorax anthurii]|uniref:Alkylation response protein AidB-like acyl-CoA dehydrogenase n=2 Tax=Paracidovorax anthurii TaxID=78229 RepID=A0A328ZSS4_9BURK|nr:alkylation response protein AidB-like acyl-CoA dehydrogenase [Paracidovorax anthurii]